MQAASTESVVNGVEPRGALPMPPTDSGETDSNCGARDALSSKGAGQCVSSVWEGAHRGLLARRALLLCLLLVLVLVDLHLDVRLEQIVLVGDLCGLDLALALRLVARVRDDPVGLALRIERAMGSVSGSADARHRMRRSPPGRASPLETPWPRRSSRRRPTQWKAGWGQGVGRQAHGAEARRSPPGRASPLEIP